MPVKNDTKKLRHHIHIDTFQLTCLREVVKIDMSDENQLVLSVGIFVSLRLELRSFVIVQGQIAQSLELDCLAEADFFMLSHQEQRRNPLLEKHKRQKDSRFYLKKLV